MKYKALILNQCTYDPSFNEIQDNCLNTWVKDHNREDIKILNYFGDEGMEPGNTDEFNIGGFNHLLVGCPDRLKRVENKKVRHDPRGVKQILALTHCLERYDFDLIYRTGCSSYIIIEDLYSWIDKLPTENLYSGHKNGFTANIKDRKNPDYFHYYVQGCHAFMSRDIVQLIVDNKDRYIEMTTDINAATEALNYEDIALGRMLNYEMKVPGITKEEQPEIPIAYNYKREEDIKKIKLKPHIFNYRMHKDRASFFLHLNRLAKYGNRE